ncbi:hypothetical protein JAAARDRAFT_28289 [Jaapia argillacea MUCL 33604]|uniref:Uncharacterized protein n=1 Tax=Jaapia argillacea MUCL 33604 TaxID=933084 RepID=A0A067QEN8_9AGAM|nr:hypothetical protein JAAARDRAFT_28289 [Jaapia argillacea MUCL 33604]
MAFTHVAENHLPAKQHVHPSNLPTPPLSPTEGTMHTAVHLLDSLQAFYHRERTWVLHTRAALEEALVKAPESPCLTDISSNNSPASFYSSSSTSDTTSAPLLPVENGTPAACPQADAKVGRINRPIAKKEQGRKDTNWHQRKRNFQLKLDGIGPKDARRFVQSARHKPVDEPRAKVLQMFGDLVDARMECCQRVNNLIRTANRADLHSR